MELNLLPSKSLGFAPAGLLRTPEYIFTLWCRVE
jgi:hypothetical protein